MMEPGKQSFHSPTSAVAAQRTTILRRRPALSAMGCDHLDAVTLGQVSIQKVTVVRFVTDQSRREGVEEAVSENAFDELAFVRRSAFDTNGESDNFRPFAAFGRIQIVDQILRGGAGRGLADAVAVAVVDNGQELR